VRRKELMHTPYRSFALLALPLFSILLLTGCDDAPPYTGPALPAGYQRYKREPKPVVDIQTVAGTIKVELDEDEAPLAVNNFVELVEAKFLDGKTFFRIDKDYMVRFGDASGNAADGKRYTVMSEAGSPKNKNDQYALALDSAYSTTQFFIVTNPKGNH